MVNIANYLNTTEFKSRQELAKETGLTERAVRRKISSLKLERPVIYNSQTKGYRLAKDIKTLKTLHEVAEEYNLIQHCINDIEARKKVFNKQERKYIAYLKTIEKIFNIKVSNRKEMERK